MAKRNSRKKAEDSLNLTPMPKAYCNEIWFQLVPKALKGKKMLVVVTAGAGENAYSHEENIGLTIGEVSSLEIR